MPRLPCTRNASRSHFPVSLTLSSPRTLLAAMNLGANQRALSPSRAAAGGVRRKEERFLRSGKRKKEGERKWQRLTVPHAMRRGPSWPRPVRSSCAPDSPCLQVYSITGPVAIGDVPDIRPPRRPSAISTRTRTIFLAPWPCHIPFAVP